MAIDGKTLRRSFDAATSKSAIHMVSAWATANQITLGQVIVDPSRYQEPRKVLLGAGVKF